MKKAMRTVSETEVKENLDATGFFSTAFGNALTGRLLFKFTEETQVAVSGSAKPCGASGAATTARS